MGVVGVVRRQQASLQVVRRQQASLQVVRRQQASLQADCWRAVLLDSSSMQRAPRAAAGACLADIQLIAVGAQHAELGAALQ